MAKIEKIKLLLAVVGTIILLTAGLGLGLGFGLEIFPLAMVGLVFAIDVLLPFAICIGSSLCVGDGVYDERLFGIDAILKTLKDDDKKALFKTYLMGKLNVTENDEQTLTLEELTIHHNGFLQEERLKEIENKKNQELENQKKDERPKVDPQESLNRTISNPETNKLFDEYLKETLGDDYIGQIRNNDDLCSHHDNFLREKSGQVCAFEMQA